MEKEQRKAIPKMKLVLGILLIGIFFFLLGTTFLEKMKQDATGNLPLFYLYKKAWNMASSDTWRYIFLHIGMFIPLGFLLPFFHKKFCSPFWNIGSGFLVAVFMELVKIGAKQGVFVADNLFHHTLGMGIGYCMAMMVLFFCQKEKKKRNIVFYSIPVLIVFVILGGMYFISKNQEFGTLSGAYVTKANIKYADIKLETSLNEERTKEFIYQTKMYTKKDVEQLAKQFFALTDLDTENLNIYDSKENGSCTIQGEDSYTLDFSYAGGSYYFSDNNFTWKQEALQDFEEDTIKELLKKFDISIPKEAVGKTEGTGTYTWEANEVHIDDTMIKGKVSCAIYKDQKIGYLMNTLTTFQKYKEIELMSEKEAYERLCKGEFAWNSEDNKINSLLVEEIYLNYEIDTKGFYQPVYVFVTMLNEQKTIVKIPAIL